MTRDREVIRLFRGLEYALFVVAGIFAFLFPTQAILNALQISLAYAWSGFLFSGGLICMAATLRRSWAGERVGIPLIVASNIIFAIALMFFGQSLASTSVGFLCMGLALDLISRWLDLRKLVQISKAVDDES